MLTITVDLTDHLLESEQKTALYQVSQKEGIRAISQLIDSNISRNARDI